VLRVQSVDAHYGRVRALKAVSIHIMENEIVALIGANGAGKTTLLSVVSGLIRPSRGDILFNGEAIGGLTAPGIVRKGIVQVPEGRQLFGPLTVYENLELGAYARFNRRNRNRILSEIKHILTLFPVLQDRRNQAAGTLSGGEQQMLAIGRGLMGAPKLLLLDEPSLGLAPLIVAEIFRIITRLKEGGTTILLVEQNARAALHVSDRAYVVETGRITMSGFSRNLLDNRDVKRAFLGKDYRDMREI
jgi:branched-chain amino acid transport system ATP-binding protein